MFLKTLYNFFFDYTDWAYDIGFDNIFCVVSRANYVFMLLGVPPRMGRKIFLWLSISVFLFFFFGYLYIDLEAYLGVA